MSAGPEEISVEVSNITWHLITHQDPDPDDDSYLVAIKKVFSQPDIVNKIFQARSLKGGWEPWAQVECALALGGVFPPNTISREEGIYNNSIDRCDLWADDKVHVAAGFEMKCRNAGMGSEQALTGLPNQMIQDIEQIHKPLKAEFPEKRVMYAIGITGNPYDLFWAAEDGSGDVLQSEWMKANPNLKAKLKWCVLSAPDPDLNVKINFQMVDQIHDWVNLYMIWYKLP